MLNLIFHKSHDIKLLTLKLRHQLSLLLFHAFTAKFLSFEKQQKDLQDFVRVSKSEPYLATHGTCYMSHHWNEQNHQIFWLFKTWYIYRRSRLRYCASNPDLSLTMY